MSITDAPRCQAHKKSGEPCRAAAMRGQKVTYIPSEWPERFWSKVDFGLSTDDCWIWIAYKTKLGYGRFGRGGRKAGVAFAHRHGWELIHGPISSGLVMDHTCRNPSCVNPKHVEPVPQLVNIMRGDLGNRNGLCRRNLHPWVPENIYLDGGRGNGRHRCKECRKEWDRQRYATRRRKRLDLSP